MKTIQQIQEQYNILTLKEGKERGHLVELANMGLLEESKIDLISTALKLEGNALSEAEKKSLVDLIQSLSSYVLSEANEKFTSSSDKSIPIILLLKRKAIRVFPGDTKVGLYYSQTLDRYISIPFGTKGTVNPVITEQRTKSNKQSKQKIKVSDDDASQLPDDLKKLHKQQTSQQARVQQAAKDIVDRTPDRDLHKIKGKFGLTAAHIANQRYDNKTGGAPTSVRLAAKAGIDTHILLKKAVHSYKERGERKQQAAAQSETQRQADLKKHTDAYTKSIGYATKTNKQPARASYASMATHAKNRIKQLGGTVPSVTPKKKIVGPISGRPGVIKPPAMAEGVVDWMKNKVRNIRNNLANKVTGKNKAKRPNMSNDTIKNTKPEKNTTDNSRNYVGTKETSSPSIENSFSKRVSVDQHQVRANRSAWGTDPYGRQAGQQNESNLDVIRKIAESNAQKAEIEFTDKCIPINYGIARKFMAVYESLNTKNREKVETMLNESSTTCSKAINFAIRS